MTTTTEEGQGRYLTVEELRRRLSISRSKAYRVAQEIGAVHVGRAVRVSLADLEKWEANNRY